MKSRTRHAVLGALAEGPRSVYAIKQDLEATVGHFWNESYGQLYPELKQMVSDGLVSVLEAGGSRDRTIYAIAPAGLDALREWLIEPSEYLPPPRNELLLKLFFGRHVPREHSLARLQRYEQQLRAALATYQAIEKELSASESEDESQPFWLVTLKSGLLGTEAAIRWCSEARHLLEPTFEPADRTSPTQGS
jgi:DNA-binding PadR family transcriptional regulator